MGEPREFREGLQVEQSRKTQIEVAEEEIRKELFRILTVWDVKEEKSGKLKEVVDSIADKLGLQGKEEHISEYVTQIFQTGRYQYILEERNKEVYIQENLSKFEKSQRKYSDSRYEYALNKLNGYKAKAEEFANQLSVQKAEITPKALHECFDKTEQEKSFNKMGEEEPKNRIWIDLAIEYVMKMQNQER